MTDLELTERCAKWIGIYEFTGDDHSVYIKAGSGITVLGHPYTVIFDPLHNWNDLMTMVVPKLQGYSILIVPSGGKFWIDNEEGKYPDDLPRAILTLIAELEEGK